jgi:hypothetical protein
MTRVEARIIGGTSGEGLGSIMLTSAEVRLSAVDLIRLAVAEQIRELTARRRLSDGEAVRALRRQYQTDGSISSLPDAGRLNPERETERALKAFTGGTCLLFIDGEQVRELDQPITLGNETKVQFLRLVPLVGG